MLLENAPGIHPALRFTPRQAPHHSPVLPQPGIPLPRISIRN